MPLLNPITRRSFLATAGLAAGAVAFTGCASGPNALRLQSTVQMPEDAAAANENWYPTVCAACEAGCGVVVRVVEGRARKVEGNPDHPLNQGKLCARGQASLQAQYNPDRLRGPMARTRARGTGPMAPTTWDGALDQLTQRLSAARQAGQAGQVALITGMPHGHQGDVLQKLADTYGLRWLRLDTMNEEPLRAAVKQVFGNDGLPYFDVGQSQTVLSFGADWLGSWLSPVAYNIQYGAFRQGSWSATAKAQQTRPRGHLIHVEPRFSSTAAAADEWLPVKPGTEGLLALAIAQALAAPRNDFYGDLSQYTPEAVANQTGIAADRIRAVAQRLRSSGPAVIFGGGSAGAHTNGVSALAAILGLNLLFDRIQIDFPPNELPQPRPSSFGDWQQLAAQLQSGGIQTVLVYGANPVYELPASLGFAQALLKAPFVASFSSFPDETTQLADLVLPSSLPLEEWSDSIAAGQRPLPVQTLGQPVLSPLYDTRSFWDVLFDLASPTRLNLRWPWTNFQQVIQPPNTTPEDWTADRGRGFIVPATGSPGTILPPSASVDWQPAQFAGEASQFPDYLMPFEHPFLGAGEGANLPWLQALPDPVTTVVWQTWVELNPRRAAQLGLEEGDLVKLETPQGSAELPVYLNPAAPPDVLGVPLGQGHTAYGRYAEKRGINPVRDLLAPLTDARSGSLAYAATRARISKTGKHMALPKFEGDVPAYQIPGKEVLKVQYGRS